MKRSLLIPCKSFSKDSKNLLTELKSEQEFNALKTKKLLKLSKKASNLTILIIFLLIVVISCFIIMSQVYLDMMVMTLNELDSIKEFLLQK